MNTPKISPVFRLLSIFGDGLTANQLSYKSDHPAGDASRFEYGETPKIYNPKFSA